MTTVKTVNNEETTKKISKQIDSFKNNSDVENLYRYIFTNNLRREARLIMREIHKKVIKCGKKKGRKLQ